LKVSRTAGHTEQAGTVEADVDATQCVIKGFNRLNFAPRAYIPRAPHKLGCSPQRRFNRLNSGRHRARPHADGWIGRSNPKPPALLLPAMRRGDRLTQLLSRRLRIDPITVSVRVARQVQPVELPLVGLIASNTFRLPLRFNRLNWIAQRQ
jgi:hypothetical protein